MSNQTQADNLSAKYIALRDFKDKIKTEMDEKLGKVNAAMDKIENEMLTFLNQTGQESAKTASGTFFKKVTTSAKVADRDVFLQFVMLNEATNFLESRVNKTAVEEYIAAHGVLPPGVDVTKVVSVGVNRPKTRS